MTTTTPLPCIDCGARPALEADLCCAGCRAATDAAAEARRAHDAYVSGEGYRRALRVLEDVRKFMEVRFGVHG
jgi:hypothetical protein